MVVLKAGRMNQHEFPCPACGFLVFDEPSGSYTICPVCGWEDDHVQVEHPDMRGGANGECLFEWQQKVLEQIPVATTEHRNFSRDKKWRPLKPEELLKQKPGPKTGLDYFHAVVSESPNYYWLKS
jgi:Cysteine-rich CPCC